MVIERLVIVGVGLIGGSIGMAAKLRGVARRVLGVGWRQSTLNLAQDVGAIDDAFLHLAPAVADADLVIFCTPVDVIASQVLEAAASCRKGTILSDAGSTKAAITDALEGKLPPHVHFVGAHPLAGSEKRGPEYADPDLFQDRLTVVTPTPASDPNAVDTVAAFWQGLGAKVRRLSPQAHDRALALTSHLPHLVAAALAGALPPEVWDLTATGFRDTTRIAAGDPGLWTGILSQNRPAVIAALERFSAQLDRFRAALEGGDDTALTHLLEEGKQVRDALGS